MIWGDKNCEHQWAAEIIEHDNLRFRGEHSIVGNEKNLDIHTGKKIDAGICLKCGATKSAFGLEKTPELYIEHTIEILREIRRVLRKDGVVWWNIGDSYMSHAGDRSKVGGFQANPNKDRLEAESSMAMKKQTTNILKDKDLCLIPFRVAIACQKDGWWVRSVIIWSKPNPMPESVHGSHFIRHCVTIEEYEKLSSMRSTKGSNKDGPADLSRMSPSQISDSEEALSAEREGASDSEGKGRKTRGQGETPSSQSFKASQARQGEAQTNKRRTEATEERSQSALRQDNKGQIQEATRLCETEASDSGRATSNRRGLAGDIESSQEPMPLLPQEESVDDRPHNPLIEGGEASEGEHSPSLSELQRQKEGQSSDALIECPGCPKCKRYNGYIRIKGSGRPTESHEYILMLTKSDDYFFDTDAVREPISESYADDKRPHGVLRQRFYPNSKYVKAGMMEQDSSPFPTGERATGRNIRSVWEFPTQPYPEAHFAVFPEKLPEICIKASTPEVGCCNKCGAPWERIIEKIPQNVRSHKLTKGKVKDAVDGNNPDMAVGGGFSRTGVQFEWEVKTLGWQPTCKCNADKVPSLVLDPFTGAGTTLWVTKKLGRRAVGYELSEEYCKLAVERNRQQGLL